MTKTLKGRVVDGKVEPLEPLDVPNGAEVRIIVELDEPDPYVIKNPHRALYGSLRPADGRFTTEEDWQEAKKMWERDL